MSINNDDDSSNQSTVMISSSDRNSVVLTCAFHFSWTLAVFLIFSQGFLLVNPGNEIKLLDEGITIINGGYNKGFYMKNGHREPTLKAEYFEYNTRKCFSNNIFLGVWTGVIYIITAFKIKKLDKYITQRKIVLTRRRILEQILVWIANVLVSLSGFSTLIFTCSSLEAIETFMITIYLIRSIFSIIPLAIFIGALKKYLNSTESVNEPSAPPQQIDSQNGPPKYSELYLTIAV